MVARVLNVHVDSQISHVLPRGNGIVLIGQKLCFFVFVDV